MYGFRLTFAVFMDGDLPNSFSAHHLLESRRSYFTEPYFCDVPRNIRLPLWSDHDIAGPHRIIGKRNLDITKITTTYWSQKNVRSLPTK